MFWITLFLAIPALALAAAVWGVLRRKWYGVLPLLVVAVAGWTWKESWSVAAIDFFEVCLTQSAANELMVVLLASGAAVMSLAALWAGWSRGWWFWRALVFSAVPASLVPLEANELILLCWLVMPALAAAALLLRNGRDRLHSPTPATERPKRQRQFSLANLLLAFIVLGLLATALRSVLVGHIILTDWGVVWLAGSMIAATLAMASPVLVRGTGRKWLIFWSAALALAVASWWWVQWNSDSLGLANYLCHGLDGSIVPMQWVILEGELCFLAIVSVLSCIYALAELSPQRSTTARIARAALLLLLLGIVAPLAMVYPRLLPPRTTTAALPVCQEYESIQRAAFRKYDLDSELERLSPTLAVQDRYLAIFNELDRELVKPGHVTRDAAALARDRLSLSPEDDPRYSLSTGLSGEILRAIHDKRDADALRLVRLQWRVGQSFYLGGTFEDYAYGFGSNADSANRALIAMAPSLSDQECHEFLEEALALEAAAPSYETLKEFDDYWLNVSGSWRNRLHDSAVWLTGEQYRNPSRLPPAYFEDLRRRSLASLRTVQYVLALELYRREHGQFPDDLASVQATYHLSEMIDTFTQKPPVYRRTDSGFLLYSVGFDGEDNGGKFPASILLASSPGEDMILVPTREEYDFRWKYFWSEYLKAMKGIAPAPVPKPAATK